MTPAEWKAALETEAYGALSNWFEGYSDAFPDGRQRKIVLLGPEPDDETVQRYRVEDMHGADHDREILVRVSIEEVT